MAITNTDYELDEHFLFTAPSGSRLRVQVLTAHLNQENDELTECRFEISVAPEEYTRIDREALFHLSPEARLSSGVRFNPTKPVQLELGLHADGLTGLMDGVPSVDEALNRLFEWSRSDDADLLKQPVLSTQNWYALHVKQAVDLPAELQGEDNKLFEGYSTIWA